ncbi:hypothetical protein Tco_1389951, partial [Tanacetum coccineum]
MDILQNTNFFRAFTASASVPAIYIQQFWNTLTYKTRLLGLIGPDIQFFRYFKSFLVDKANLGIAPQKGKKTKPHVIPYCRFTKLIICYLGRTHNIHQRSASPFHLAKEDHKLGNLKFVPKGEEDEVFGMQIPKELITDNIRNASYFNAYLEMVTKHDHKSAAAEGGKKKSASKTNQSKKPATAKLPKPVLLLVKKAAKVSEESRIGKVFSPVVDERDEEPQLLPETSVEVKGKGIATDETGCTVTVRTANAYDGDHTYPAGPDPGQSYVALAGPNPEPMHEDFVATVNPQVHESLKHTDEEHVHLENPLSSTGTLSSMKNLDNFNFGDQFFNDKPTEEKPDKANMETEVESMVTVPIHQASSSVSPLSTPIIDLTPPKPVSSTIQAPIFTSTTTTTLPLPPPPQQQSSSDPDLASRVSALEQVCANFEKKHKLQDNTVQGLSSRVFTLELRDLPHQINQTVNEVVKEAVQTALQALLRELFRDLFESEMKEILHQRMFESGTYQSQPEHVALYEALEASMDRDNRDEFLEATTKSRMRRRDDQDPLPPSPDSDQGKNKRHDSESPSSSSKQKSIPHSEQPVKEVPIPDDVNISDSEDIDTAHLPKIKTRPDWLKPIPEEDRPETPEPDWVIPPNDLLEAENNWAVALAKSYKDSEENKLLSKTGDMGSFIKWYCKR